METLEINLDWINHLPNVDEEIKEERDVLIHMLRVADNIQSETVDMKSDEQRDEVARMLSGVDKIRDKARLMKLSLENDVKARWTAEQINQAKKQEMEKIRARHEALAKAKGATKFQFVVMQDGVDFGCHADFGNGMEPFYPDKEVEVANETIDVLQLAKTGFTLIRSLLEGRISGGIAAATDLADALHNLPEPGNKFLEELTLKNLDEFGSKYPQLRSILF